MPKFAVGQYVELYPTIPAPRGGSIASGTRGIVDAVEARDGEPVYLVAFLASERRTGEVAWLREADLFAA